MLRLISFLASCALMYTLLYPNGEFVTPDYYSPKFILVAIMLLINGYLLLRFRSKEGFFVPRIIVDVADPNRYPNVFYMQTGNEFIWQNNGKIEKKLVGDHFGTIVLKPGTSFKYAYDTPGTYKYYLADNPDAVGLINVDRPDYALPASYYNEDGSNYSSNYYEDVNRNIYGIKII